MADNLGATAKLLDGDPNETLVVIGPRAASATRWRSARPCGWPGPPWV